MPIRTLLAVLFFSCTLFVTAFSQQHFSAKWNVYTSMKNVRGVGISGNHIWAASSGGLFSFEYDNPAATLKKFTIIDGLLSNELTCNTVDNLGNVWCGGQDGSISVYNPVSNIWKVVTDIQNSSETNKQIFDMFQYGNSMFISTEFSLIKFNVNNFEFVDQPYTHLGSLQTPNPVNETKVINDTVWAATKNGIAYANINSALTIQSNWKNFTTTNSVLHTNQINSVAYFDGKMIFATERGMVAYSNGTLVAFAPQYSGISLDSLSILNITSTNGSLYISTHNSENNTYKVDNVNPSIANLVLPNVPVNTLQINSQGDLIIGTAISGVLLYRNSSANYVLPNGPNSNVFSTLEVDNNQNVWGTSGGTGEGIYRLGPAGWRNFTAQNTPNLGTADYRHVYASHYSDAVYFAGYGNGLLRIVGDSLYRFTNQNSCLRSLTGDFVLVEGIKEDNSGNLWMINRAAALPTLKFSINPLECVSYPARSNQTCNTMLYMDIDNYNTKWMTLPNDVTCSTRGLIYFNESVNTDAVVVGTSLLGQNVNAVNHIVVEKNGEVWIATDNGIAIVHDPYQIVANPNSIPQIEKMRIIENGLSTPLLENVQYIAVDALNNKWIGTISNGLIYVSSDGSTLLGRYNMANSPLPDNRISSIVVDPKSGIAYFGTEKGMASFQTIAVQPLENCDQMKFGPSPFIIPNASLLKIDGLVAESTVKILTISGTLVFEFKTEGGKVANWDGRDFNGNLVSSGIYLVAGYNKDATKVCTGKIAIVRK